MTNPSPENVPGLAASLEPEQAPLPAHLQLKATALLLALVLLIVGAALYLSYARGAFESTQRLVLVTDDSEGVVVGMDMTFAGFPIGRVGGIELAGDGNVHILVDVAHKDAHWLRTSSVFTLARGVVGNTALRAYSGIPADPPLPDGVKRPALRGDASAEIPRLLGDARQLLQNLNAMTAADAPLNASLAGVQAFTDRLKGADGALGALLGTEAPKVSGALATTLARTNTLLARVDALALQAQAQVFGRDGVVTDARATVAQLTGMLSDARASLVKVDAVLDEARAVGANARVASADLGVLRAEVERSLRQIDQLIHEINRTWPFARDATLTLP